MPLEIDDRFVDVDFTQEQPYVFGDLGCRLFGDPEASYEDRFGTLSEREIDEEIEKIDAAGGGAERLVTRIYNQQNEGSCTANAVGQAAEIVQAKQFGKENVVHLSAISLYKRIGSSPNSGSTISDGWAELNRRGILPLDTPENRQRFGEHVMPNVGFRTRFPDGWESTAILFAGVEATIIRSTAGLYTALCRQEPVVVGRQGHAICYVRPMRRNGRRMVAYANSWGNWGQGLGDHSSGFGFDTEGQIRQAASWAFALRSVRVPTK